MLRDGLGEAESPLSFAPEPQGGICPSCFWASIQYIESRRAYCVVSSAHSKVQTAPYEHYLDCLGFKRDLHRDETLAAPGKTGLIASMLFDYELTRKLEEMGWYEELKALSEVAMINNLDPAAFPGIKDAVLGRLSSTPLTISRIAGTADGAIAV